MAFPLPRYAQVTLNHCNLPALILGSLSFQDHPAALTIDGTASLFAGLRRRLDELAMIGERVNCFHDYMTVHFSLHEPEAAGHSPVNRRQRVNANYLRLLRGWFFDADGRDAAVLRGWVESRFGLIPRYHNGAISDSACENYHRYLQARASGLYNTNALEAQLDMVYTWCQYELRRALPDQQHVVLYRGISSPDVLERLCGDHSDGEAIVVLNNLSSFSAHRERAEELGACLIAARVPREKILLYPALTTGFLNSEQEYLVIGGVYRVSLLKSLTL